MTEPTDYFAAALAEADSTRLAPMRAAQLEALIVALLERGVAPDDPRVPLYLAPLLRTVAVRRNTAAADRQPEGADPGLTLTGVGTAALPEQTSSTAKEWLEALLVSAATLGCSVIAVRHAPFVPPEPASTVDVATSTATTTTTTEIPQLPLYLFNHPVIVGLALLIALAVAWPFVWRWWQRRSKRLLRRGPLPDRSEMLSVATSAARARLFDDPLLALSLRKLRRHRAVPSQAFDVRASIKATIANGAQPVMRFARRRLSPDYVLMSERERPHDHLAELAAAWSGRLCEAGISCEHYEFFGDPNTLRQVTEGTGRAVAGVAPREGIDAVLARHEGAQLVVMLESFEALVEPDAAPQWLAASQQKAAVHHMNPRDPAYWDRLEVRLETLGMRSFAASVTGSAGFADRIDRLIDDADAAEPPLSAPGQADLGAFLAEHRALVLSPDRPEDSQIAKIIDTLERWLDRDAYDWLRALAVFPMINSSFTFFAGCVLKDATIITHDRYRTIARLPWLRVAYMPDWLRLALVETLSPEALERAAAVAAAFLTPPGRKIDQEQQLLELRVAAQSATQQKDLAKHFESGAHPGYNDRLLIEALKGQPPDKLGVIVRGDFLPPPPPWWRTTEFQGTFAGIVGAAMLLFLQPEPWQHGPSGYLQSGTYDGDPVSVPSTTPSAQPSTDSTPPPSASIETAVPDPAQSQATAQTGPIVGDSATIYIQYGLEGQHQLVQRAEAALSGAMVGGVSLSVPSPEFRSDGLPDATQLRCFDLSGCALAAQLQVSLQQIGIAAKPVLFRTQDLSAGRRARPNQIELWFGKVGGDNVPPPTPDNAVRSRWFKAVSDGDVRMIRSMVAQGLVGWTTIVDDQSNTPLHLASERCNLTTMALFLQNGGDPDRVNVWGDSSKRIAEVRCKGGLFSSQYRLLNQSSMSGDDASGSPQGTLPTVRGSGSTTGLTTGVIAPGPFIVLFDFDSTKLTPEASSILNGVVAAYNKGGPWKINVLGYRYVDGWSGIEIPYGLGLALERADEVKTYLVRKGIPNRQITTGTFGESTPRVAPADGVREPQNRRVEIIFELAKARAPTAD